MWDRLKAHHAATRDRAILDLFAADPGRAQDFAVEACGMRLDWSKTTIDATARDLLLELAEAAGVATRRAAMFSGAKINETEGRAVLHSALRNLDGSVIVDGADVMPAVRETLSRMEGFADDVRHGRFAGAGGAFTDVVNIGIGGAASPGQAGPSPMSSTSASAGPIWGRRWPARRLRPMPTGRAVISSRTSIPRMSRTCSPRSIRRARLS